MSLRSGQGSRNGRESNVRSWRGLLDAIPDPAVIVSPDYRVMAANQATLTALSTSGKSGIRKKHCYETFHGSVQPPRECPLSSVLKGIQTKTVELDLEAFRGRFAITCAPVRDSSGSVVGAIHVSRRSAGTGGSNGDDADPKPFFEAAGWDEKYRALVDNANESILVVQDGIVKYANPQAGQHGYGYTAEDFLSRPMQEFVHEDDRELAMGYHRRRLEGDQSPHEFCLRVIDKGGAIRWVENRSVPIVWGGRPASLAMLTNITERKEAEEKYRSIFENAMEGIFQSSPEGRFIRVNPAMARICGFSSPDEMVSGIRSIRDEYYADPEEGDLLAGYLEKWGVVENWEHQIYGKDRRRIWVSTSAVSVRDAAGRTLHHEGAIIDITERKLMQQRLTESEERYRIAIENSLDGVAIMRGNVHLYVNKRFVEMFGYDSPEEIVGKPVGLVLSDGDVGKTREINKKRDAGEPVPERYELRGTKKNGEDIFIEVSAARTIYQGESVDLRYLRDVTERRRAEENRVRLEAQLIQAQKMEAVGQLAGGVAHDFNNILTTVIGYANLVQMKIDRDDPLRIYVEQILNASQKAAMLTHSLLAFSRKQVIELKPHNLDTLVKGVEKLLRRLLIEDVEMKLSLAAENLTVLADVTQIDQVLINLVTNARDAMPDGGTLLIETKAIDVDEEFRKKRGYGKLGRYALLSVNDTGVGMDARTKEKIFEPFFTTKEIGKGTGLGLSIVYGIVKQHDGYVEVESQCGKGTSFRVYLPEVKARAQKTKREVRRIEGGDETILVAEDDDEVRKLTKTVLEDSGYKVVEAMDGEEAVSAFRVHKDHIDAVILDVIMPKKSGKEVYEALRKMRPGLKALFISGYTPDIITDKGFLKDTFDYVSKPLSPQEMLTKLREVLNRKK
jgi:two-component system, cell cycle sensor histidine kinase and response regulator CckA